METDNWCIPYMQIVVNNVVKLKKFMRNNKIKLSNLVNNTSHCETIVGFHPVWK